MPLMAAFQWSYSHHIASSEGESPLEFKLHPLEIFSDGCFFVVGPHTLLPTYQRFDMSPTMAAADPNVHMTTIQWRFSHDITPGESLRPLLYEKIVSLFFLPLDLRRWPTYGRHRHPLTDAALSRCIAECANRHRRQYWREVNS